MKRDFDGFLLANFNRMLPEWEEPFVFPSQVEQAFFLEVEETPGWRVVCHKQARNRRVEGTHLEFHLENHEAFVHRRPQVVRPVQNTSDFVPLTRMDTWEDQPLDTEAD
jgi:hypothetical protein